MIFVGAVCLLFACFTYLMLRQGGRILVRLEAIEQRLPEVARVPPPESDNVQGLSIGADAPNFALADLNGAQAAFEQFRGRRVLLTFFNPDCGFCKDMLPDLAGGAWAGSEADPVAVIVSMGSAERNREVFSQSTALWPRVMLQRDMEVATEYKVGGSPMGYLVSADGKIASELAVGAEELFALVRDGAESAVGGDGTNGRMPVKVYRGNRPVSDSRLQRDGLPAGTPAPAIRLPSLEGGEVDLQGHLGRRVLLVFSDPDCGPCQQLTPKLERLHQERADLDTVVVSRGDAESNRLKFAEATFPVALQRRWEISKEYGMFATPIGYLIDEQGVIMDDVAVGPEAILALAATSASKPLTNGVGKEA